MYLVGKALEMEGLELNHLALNFRSKGGGFPRGTLETILDSVEGKDQPERKPGDPRRSAVTLFQSTILEKAI